jgi:cystathionine beta-lyase
MADSTRDREGSAPQQSAKAAPSTTLIHHPYQPPGGFGSVQPAVHKASTVLFENVAALRARDWKQKAGYTYGLHGTPTTFLLEERIATLEGGVQTLLTPSGLAAIVLVDCALLAAGDEVLIPDNAYGPSKDFARAELSRWGIAHRFYDPMDVAGFAAAIGPKTRLAWIEPPGSVTMEFPDVPALVAAARERGVLVALDNTWGAGLAFDAFDLVPGGSARIGADVVIQALTKYPSGGADLLMGAVTTRDPDLHIRLKMTHMRMGIGVGANDVEAVLRALPSLDLRYTAQGAAGLRFAQWWAQRPEVARVLHPALPGAPGHEHWTRLCSRAAGLFSVVFDERIEPTKVDAFVDALRLFRIGYSWAGPVSLAVPYDVGAARNRPAWRGRLVRFSMGLEAVDDLIADAEQALAATLGSVQL